MCHELQSSRGRFGPGPRISIRARGKDEAPQSRGRMYDCARPHCAELSKDNACILGRVHTRSFGP